ncbi:MAG TPA: hypothetical protein VGD43_24370 [Micromonospora sp.]
MAEIPVRTASLNGVNLALAAAASGDTAKAGDGYTLVVANASGSPLTVTFDITGDTSYGVAAPDKTFTVPAGETWAIPLYEVYRQSADRMVHVGWSSTTSITRAVLKR